jgi:hypothetical protein
VLFEKMLQRRQVPGVDRRDRRAEERVEGLAIANRVLPS